jgi:hypothetical protein
MLTQPLQGPGTLPVDVRPIHNESSFKLRSLISSAAHAIQTKISALFRRTHRTTISDIPLDKLKQIFSYLSSKDLVAASLVSKNFHVSSQDTLLKSAQKLYKVIKRWGYLERLGVECRASCPRTPTDAISFLKATTAQLKVANLFVPDCLRLRYNQKLSDLVLDERELDRFCQDLHSILKNMWGS